MIDGYERPIYQQNKDHKLTKQHYKCGIKCSQYDNDCGDYLSIEDEENERCVWGIHFENELVKILQQRGATALEDMKAIDELLREDNKQEEI